MANTLYEIYEEVYKMNLDLLKIAQQGKWDEFTPLAEVYVVKLHDAINNQFADVISNDYSDLSEILIPLVNNEDEIKKLLRDRLTNLKNDISSLNNRKKCTEAYSSQFIGSRHH